MTCRADSIYVRSPDVIACDSACGLLLLPLSDGMGDAVNHLYVTGETGRRVWQQFDGATELTEIVQEMLQEYTSAPAMLAADVDAFVRELLDCGLIRRKSAPSSVCPDRNGVPHEAADACRTGLTANMAMDINLPFPPLIALMTAALERGASFRFQARGHSMMPFIRYGDILTVAAQSGDSIRIGDVLAFRTADPARLIVHRLIRRTNAGLLFRGDGDPDVGETVALDDVLGRVVRIERNRRRVRFGLGAERRWLAELSRCGWLQKASRLWKFLRPRTGKMKDRVSDGSSTTADESSTLRSTCHCRSA